MGSPRPLIAFTAATAVVVGAIASLATGSWWFLAVAVLLHAAGTVLVLTITGRRLADEDKPDPVTQARLDEEAAERGAR